MEIEPLIAHFATYWPLDEAAENALRARVTKKVLNRRQFLLQEGSVCKEYAFVVEGCLKMYRTDAKGMQHNLQFVVENEWIADIGSFHSERPSDLEIEALEPVILLQIAKSDLIHLYTHHPQFDRIFRVQVEDAYVNLQKRLLQSISSTAEERYLDFLSSYPELSKRISNVQIASYIGVTPEFLSRIRKSLASL
jgi:CRP/FNR family transcriptional regulator, anaerobic regulatory protein